MKQEIVLENKTPRMENTGEEQRTNMNSAVTNDATRLKPKRCRMAECHGSMENEKNESR